jgi:hypothetical protein
MVSLKPWFNTGAFVILFFLSLILLSGVLTGVFPPGKIKSPWHSSCRYGLTKTKSYEKNVFGRYCCYSNVGLYSL